jgi:hypothetical protein
VTGVVTEVVVTDGMTVAVTVVEEIGNSR